MSVVTPAAVRRGVAAHLRAHLLPGWTESPVPFDRMLISIPRVLPAWGLKIGRTDGVGGRQRVGGGSVSSTEVLVRYMVALRASGSLPAAGGDSDLDRALDLEEDLASVLLNMKHINAAGIAPVYQDADGRATVGDGTVETGVIRFVVLHHYPG